MPERTFEEREELKSLRHSELRDVYPELRTGVQDIQVYDALQRLWIHRRMLIGWIAAFLLGGVLLVLFSPKEYRAEAVLLPENISGSKTGGLGASILQNFGGMLGGGISPDLLNSDQALTFQLYPDVLKSTPVQLSLLNSSVTSSNAKVPMALGAYLDEHLPFTAADGIGRVISAVRGSGSTSPGAPPLSNSAGILTLNSREKRLIDKLSGRLNVLYDRKTELITISVEMPDPVVAAQTAGAAVDALTTYVTNYRVQKLSENMDFLEGRHREAQQQFQTASRALARFRDQNHNLARDIARTEEDRLEAEFNIAFSVYNSLASQVEEARIRVQEETPVFQILQPVAVPHVKSSPQTLLVLFLSLLFGTILGVCYILLRPSLHTLFHLLRQSDGKRRRKTVIGA